MALRLIEMIIPLDAVDKAREQLAEFEDMLFLEESSGENRATLRLILPVERTEAVLDFFEKTLAGNKDARLILSAVEATLPRVEEKEPEEEESEEPAETNQEEVEESKKRLSREELYQDIYDSSGLTGVYLVMVGLSAIVAAAGMLRNNSAVVIGAMIIAPLLGPNVALSLATTLADRDMGRRALKAILAGVAVTVGLSFLIGLIFQAETVSRGLAARAQVRFDDLAVATAAGVAGALAFTSGLPATILGVMVAVALLPPLVAFGILFGAAEWSLAVKSLVLFLVNMICINLAGVVTFRLQGIRPIYWWEASKAKKSSSVSIMLFVLLLAALALLIVKFN